MHLKITTPKPGNIKCFKSPPPSWVGSHKSTKARDTKMQGKFFRFPPVLGKQVTQLRTDREANLTLSDPRFCLCLDSSKRSPHRHMQSGEARRAVSAAHQVPARLAPLVRTQVCAAPAAAPAHSCWKSPRDRPEERGTHVQNSARIPHPSKKSSGWKPPSAAGVIKAITSGQKYRHLTTSANYKSKHLKNFKVHRTFVLTIHIYHCMQL